MARTTQTSRLQANLPGFSIEIINDEELIRFFNDVSDPDGSIKRSIERMALNEAAKKLAAMTRKNIKSMTRGRGKNPATRLHRSVRTRQNNDGRKGILRREVYFERKKTRSGYHAHLVEFGHRIVVQDPYTGKRTFDTGKRTRPVPFLRRAVKEIDPQMLGLYRKGFRKGVEKARKKYGL